MNVPRITSKPKTAAMEAAPRTTMTTRRVVICDVVRSRRAATRLPGVQAAARRSPQPTATMTSTNTARTARPTATNTSSWMVDSAGTANSTPSSAMLANSATAPPATTSVPTSECRLRVSRSTGTTMPTEVEQRATATSSGVNETPAACRANAPATARTNETTNPTTPSLSGLPRSAPRSSSAPARNSRNATPSRARKRATSSTRSQPSTCGPTRMPATISSTIAGTRSRGKKPSRKGTPNASTEMPNRLKRYSSVTVLLQTVARAWRMGHRQGPTRAGPAGPAASSHRFPDRDERASPAVRRSARPSGGRTPSVRRRCAWSAPGTVRP